MGEPTTLPQTPIAGGEGASFPLPENLDPAVGPLSLRLRSFRPHPDPKYEA